MNEAKLKRWEVQDSGPFADVATADGSHIARFYGDTKTSYDNAYKATNALKNVRLMRQALRECGDVLLEMPNPDDKSRDAFRMIQAVLRFTEDRP